MTAEGTLNRVDALMQTMSAKSVSHRPDVIELHDRLSTPPNRMDPSRAQSRRVRNLKQTNVKIQGFSTRDTNSLRRALFRRTYQENAVAFGGLDVSRDVTRRHEHLAGQPECRTYYLPIRREPVGRAHFREEHGLC
jgi:hypothetical protein